MIIFFSSSTFALFSTLQGTMVVMLVTKIISWVVFHDANNPNKQTNQPKQKNKKTDPMGEHLLGWKPIDHETTTFFFWVLGEIASHTGILLR